MLHLLLYDTDILTEIHIYMKLRGIFIIRYTKYRDTIKKQHHILADVAIYIDNFMALILKRNSYLLESMWHLIISYIKQYIKMSLKQAY